MDFHVMTLFPDMIMQGLSDSVIGRAVRKETIGLHAVNIRILSMISINMWTIIHMAAEPVW